MVQIKMDSWEFDDFERELVMFSEIPKTHDMAPIKTPRMIEDYNARISSNRTGSIFDNDYGVLPEHAELNDADNVTYVISGRGRGGKNTYYRPGGPIKGKVELDNEEQILQELRIVSGLGYSNEIIQLAVKREQAKSIEPAPEKSGGSSRTNSRAELKISSESPSSKSFESTEKDNISLTEDEVYQDCRSDTPSTSANSSITENVNSNNNNNNLHSNSPSLLENGRNDISNYISQGAIPKKPLPLSQILKQNRQNKLLAKKDDNSQNVLEHPTIVNDVRIKTPPVKSVQNRKKLPTLLDVSETKSDTAMVKNVFDNKKSSKVLKNTNIQNTTNDVQRAENRHEELPWRRRDNVSPPRFVWGATKNTTKTLDIRSIIDFPTLK